MTIFADFWRISDSRQGAPHRTRTNEYRGGICTQTGNT